MTVTGRNMNNRYHYIFSSRWIKDILISNRIFQDVSHVSHFYLIRKCETIVKPVHYDVIEVPSNAEEIIENGAINEKPKDDSVASNGEVIQIQNLLFYVEPI